MKKFLGLIVLLVALAVCAAALVACDLGSGNQATPQSIQFEDKDGADRSTYWDLGAFPYGTAYEDILPTFKVNLCYSDGSTKELAAGEYTVSYLKIDIGEVPLAEMPAVPDAGYYQIVFDKDTFQARMMFTVESVVRTDLTLSLPHNEWEYDEANPTPTVGGYSATDGDEPLFYCVDKAAFDALTDEQKAEYWLYVTPMYNMGEVPCTIAVGEYYAYAEIPQDNNFTVSYTAVTPENAFTVKKAVLHYASAVPSNLQAVFNYHSGIQGGINLGSINITVKDFSIATGLKDRTGAEILGEYVWENSSVSIDSDDNGTTFPARYQLNSLCEACYTVEDGSIPVTLTVNKGAVMQPQLSIDSDKAHSANEGFGPYPDNALPYAVVNDDGGYNVRIFGEWDKNIIEITVKRLNSDGSSTTNKVTGLIGTLLDDGTYKYCLSWAFINPAEYAVTLSLKDKTNFTWYDGTTEDSVFRFEIKEKKAVSVPSVHLRDSVTGTDGVDFVTLDGQNRCIDFTDFTDSAIEPALDGEYRYPTVDTGNTAYYLLEADELEGFVDTSVGYGTITVTLVPADEYTWEDGSVTPVEYTCKIRSGSTFFPDMKIQTGYTVFDPTNPTTADDAEVMQLMNDWFGVEIEEGEKIPSKMETDCRNYKAAVYFYASQDDNKAKYVGTVTNSHTSPDNFDTYSMTFHLTDFADKSAPKYYYGKADVEAGSRVSSTIYPKGESISVNKITDYDMPFFLIAKVDCRETVQSENITYAYSTHIDGYTFVKIEGDNGGDGVTTEKVTSEVYLVFRGGEYVGHEINTTVKIDEVNTTYFLQFALIP